MIGSLMYRTSSHPDIMFVVYYCARFQENPRAPHMVDVKNIFQYLKRTTFLGIWYPSCNDQNFQINSSFFINQNILIKYEISMTIIFKIHSINILFHISECPIKKIVEECMPHYQALPLLLGSDVPENKSTNCKLMLSEFPKAYPT